MPPSDDSPHRSISAVIQADQQREVTIYLEQPLGPRVLVDLDATPVQVLQTD